MKHTSTYIRKEGYIGDIMYNLATPYIEGSAVWEQMWRNLRKLNADTLNTIALNARVLEASRRNLAKRVVDNEN